MRDLTPVRLTGGGTQLVLVDGKGVEYAVPIARIHQILGNARGVIQQQTESATGTTSATPRPGIRREKVDQRMDQKMESALRPRDIQTRIRAGESPEDVAAVAGTSVDRVMIFAAPVLAERAHIARSAQSSSVRRSSAEPSSTVRTLGPSASARLREEGVDPESIEWDAWRRDDGRWALVASYHHDGEARTARFSFDQPGHFVAADDDEGRWLVGDGQFPSREQKAQATTRRLTPVPRYDEELPLGDDAIELVREEPDEPAVTTTAPATPEAPAAHQHPVAPEPDAVTGDADWIAPAKGHHGSPLHASAWVDGPEEREAPVDDVLPLETEPETEPGSELEAEPETEGEVVAEAEPGADPAAGESSARRPAKKGRGRASVPTWDEIMFGGGRGD